MMTSIAGRVSLRSSRLLALAVLLAWPAVASAWNSCGHSTIDLLAYRQVSPETRAKLDLILSHHPRYRQDLLKEKPEGVSDAEFAFARAGTWPDIVRDRGNPMNALYHKGNWHYTDVPYHPEGGEEKYRGEVSKPEKPGMPYDSISAYKYNLARLNDETVTLSERAVALCWVLHLGGDIHQPCHNVSLYSSRFPTGDRGANLWLMMDGDKQRNLHSLWDGWIGDDHAMPKVMARADEIAGLHPRSEFAEELKQGDVAQWVQEGRFLALKYVYLEGKVQGVTKTELEADPKLVVPAVSEEYREQATEVSLRRAALAGYRLTDALGGLTLVIPATPVPEAVPTTRP